MFTSVTNFEKVLTFETEEYWLCVPCRHRMCRGWRLKVTSLCGVCGHQACEECFANGGIGEVMSQMMGPTCCACRKEEDSG